MARVICKNCGAEMVLPEKSETIVGRTISEESKGNYILNTKENKKMTKAEERMSKLREAGADMSKYFEIDGMLIKMENGVPTKVDLEEEKANDPILQNIYKDGYVRNTMLHRRWVLAQMWDMLKYRSWDGISTGYDAALKARGYAYQWKMLLEEIRVLSKLEQRDETTFNQRTHFFNMGVVEACCNDFMTKLESYIEIMRVRRAKKCKGIPYITIYHNDVFISDLEKKVYAKVRKDYQEVVRACKHRENYAYLYNKLNKFIHKWVKYSPLTSNEEMCSSFKDAYKGAGGYYSLRNLLQFHDCCIEVMDKYERNGTGEFLKGEKAIEYIDSKLDAYRFEGWRYLAMLKKCIFDNGWTPNWK